MGCSCYIGCGTRSARLKWACFGATVALCIICNAIGNAYMEPCQDPVTMACFRLQSVDPHNEACQKPLTRFYECTSRVMVQLVAFSFLTDYFLLMAVVMLCIMCCCSRGPRSETQHHETPIAPEAEGGRGIREPLLRPTV